MYLLLVVVLLSVILWIWDVFNGHSQGLTLPIERVYLVVIGIVKTLLREVLAVTLHIDSRMLGDLSIRDVEEEVMVNEGGGVEQIHKKQMVSDKNTLDEWVREVVDWHCVVVKTQSIIDIEFIFFDLFFTSCMLPECPQFENTVIKICHCKN